MHKCKNPECGKEIPDSLEFCSRECTESLKESSKGKPKSKDREVSSQKYEYQMLRNGIGLRIELQMSRGPPVRGVLKDYDPEFQKLAVMEDVGNNQRKLTFVKLNYVSALSLYGENLGNEA